MVLRRISWRKTLSSRNWLASEKILKPYAIVENATYERLASALSGKVVIAGPKLKKGDKVTATYLRELLQRIGSS